MKTSLHPFTLNLIGQHDLFNTITASTHSHGLYNTLTQPPMALSQSLLALSRPQLAHGLYWFSYGLCWLSLGHTVTFLASAALSKNLCNILRPLHVLPLSLQVLSWHLQILPSWPVLVHSISSSTTSWLYTLSRVLLHSHSLYWYSHDLYCYSHSLYSNFHCPYWHSHGL